MTFLALLLAIDLFTLPAIPEALQVPEDRLVFLAEHYWDHTPLSTELIEQHHDQYEQYLVDFLSLLPLLDAERHADLLRPILAYSATLVRQYLCTPDSPIYAPEVYQNALRSFQKLHTTYVLRFDYRDDCDTCHDIQQQLDKSSLIADAIAQGHLQVKATRTELTPLLSLMTPLGETLFSEIKVEEIETILQQFCAKN